MQGLRNFEQALQEMASVIPAGQLGAEQIAEMGYNKAALIAYLSKFGVEINETTLSKRIQQSQLCDGAVITGLNNLELFSGDFASDFSNMKNGTYTLPQDEHKVVYGFKVEVASGATVPPVDWTLGANASDAVLNGFATISNNGQTVAADIPLADAITELTDKGVGYIALTQPIVWKGQTDLTMSIKFKRSSVADLAIRITYVSLGLIS